MVTMSGFNFSPDTLFNAFLSLLAILNPITVVPLYGELTQDLPRKDRAKVLNTAVMAGFITLAVLTYLGQWMMNSVFHISIAEFRIAGGILLTVIAVKQIVYYDPEEYHQSPQKVMEMGVVPMAIPMLVGPGSIVTGILILDRDGWLVALIALAGNFLVSFVVIRNSVTLNRIMGKFGTLVVARILWIFIAAIGAHFLISGVADTFGLTVNPRQ